MCHINKGAATTGHNRPQHHYGLPTYKCFNHPTTKMAHTKETACKSTGGSSAHKPCNQGSPQSSPSLRRNKEAPHHYRPRTVVLCKSHHYKNTDFLICKLPFQCLARELLLDWKMPDSSQFAEAQCFQAMSLLALQESMEAFSMQLFEDVNLCVFHAKRVTVIPKTFNLHF